jgi:hypothetical protein
MSDASDNPYQPPQLPADDAMPVREDAKLVCIGSFADRATANIARSVLASEGIPACLGAEETATMLWHVGTALGGIKLYVFADQEAKARALLEAHSAADLDERLMDQDDEQAPSDDGDEDEESADQQAYDGHVRRAWIASVLSVVFCPVVLNVYSLYILFGENLFWYPAPVRPNWRAMAALFINVIVLGGVAFVILASDWR